MQPNSSNVLIKNDIHSDHADFAVAKMKSDSGSGPGFSKLLDYGFGSEINAESC